MKRVLLWAVAVVATIAAVGLIAWVLVPPALVNLDFGNEQIDDSVRAQAIGANRQSVLLAVGGLIALVGVVVTVTRLYLEREADRRAEAAHDLERDENRTSRYATAIEQLGSERAEIQLGGIYALERLAIDSLADRHVIGAVLAAFLRTRAKSGDSRGEPERAAAYVVARVDFRDLDLTGARLNDLDLRGGALRGALLIGAQMDRTDLDAADLEGAVMREVDATSLTLNGASLNNAVIENCNFHHLSADETSFVEATIDTSEFLQGEFHATRFEHARLQNVGFTGSTFDLVDFENAQLYSVDMGSVRCLDNVRMRRVRFGGTTALPRYVGDGDRIDLAGATAGVDQEWPVNMESHVLQS